jgi:uncharacterized protein YndB with AHSA1/START domain
MNNPLVVKNTVTINASASKVWETLTSPEKTKQYMFGCEAISDWKVGSPLVWKMLNEGKEFIAVKGIILSIDAPSMLKYSVIDPHADMEDVPENYLNVTYQLAGKDNHTILTVIQDGFENAANGLKRYEEANNKGEGWNPILNEIKKVAEQD